MRLIPLTKGYFAMVDDEDYDGLMRFKWTAITPNPNVYAQRGTRNRTLGTQAHFLMHRVITNAPTGAEVDHIDRNGLNNCKGNLRLCTRSENARNCSVQPNTKTGFKGVWPTRSGRQWEASICFNREQIYLGLFDTPEEAAAKYNSAALFYHGEFASLNLI